MRAALVLLFAALPVLAWSAPKSPTPVKAPSFTLPTRNGTASLDSLRGRVVLVDFWASWCTPCRQSFPWMDSLMARYAGKGLSIVAVNVDKDRAAADSFLIQHTAAFTVVYDPSGKTAVAYGVTGMPMSFVIARDGTIFHKHIGYDPKKSPAWEELIEEKLKP